MCTIFARTGSYQSRIQRVKNKIHSVSSANNQSSKEPIYRWLGVACNKSLISQERGITYNISKNAAVGNNPRSEIEQRLCPLKFGSSIDPVVGQLPDKAKIVIVGGGAQGMAIAYKLALKGYGPDTVIIDQGQIGGGSTWNSAGIVSMLAKSSVEMRLSR